jgi:tetratricopeptide (TPR) repeat protein
MQLMWRRVRGWVLILGSVLAGAGCGVAVGYLLSDRVAGAVAGVVTAVAGAAGARGMAAVEKRSERRAAIPGSVASGRLARVRDLADPVMLGVHPAAADDSGRVPRYIRRDIDQRLDDAIREGGFILVSGESTAGKSRAAFEAMQRLLPDHVLVAPADRQSVQLIVEVALEQRRCVVWLDDIERFFGAGGLAVPAISRLLRGGAVVLGTIRVSELDKFRARREAGLDASQLDSWRAAREVLDLATEIPLPRRWSGTELARAKLEAGDRRIRAALVLTDAFGLAELLADGPELAGEWRDAWRAGGHPRGAALVNAAVDCRRAGLHDPVTVELLDQLAGHYLAARGGALLRPEPIDQALAWATEPARGASSLLMPTRNSDRYLAFDYLIDLPAAPVPLPVWEALVGWSSPEQALSIGLAARQFARFEVAQAAYQKAADADVPGADIELGNEVGASGHPDEAVRLLTVALGRRQHNDPETVRIRSALARYTEETGQSDIAAAMFIQLLDDCRRILGPGHPDTLTVRLQAAFQAGHAGEPAQARDQLAELEADYARLLGADHPDTLDARHLRAIWTGRAGDPAGALALLARIRSDRIRVQGPDHPNMLSARFHIAVWTSNSGKSHEAIEMFRELLPDSIRVLGPDHPHTLSARYRLGVSAQEAGQTEIARSELTIVHEQYLRAYGADHPRTRNVQLMLDQPGQQSHTASDSWR